jgi:hypothetical protein
MQSKNPAFINIRPVKIYNPTNLQPDTGMDGDHCYQNGPKADKMACRLNNLPPLTFFF